MQHNILSTMRSLKLQDGCRSTQVYAINNSDAATSGDGGAAGAGKFLNPPNKRSLSNLDSKIQQTNFLQECLSPYGLPTTDLLEPQIEPCLKFVDFIETLGDVYRRIEGCPQFDKSQVYLEQCAIFWGMSDPKCFRQSLRSPRQHAVDVHAKVVLSAWLRFDRREDEFVGSSALDCSGKSIECPKASLVSGYDPESIVVFVLGEDRMMVMMIRRWKRVWKLQIGWMMKNVQPRIRILTCLSSLGMRR